MYCPKCGVETEQQIKFCKSCGHKLAEHARLLVNTEDQEQEKTKERMVRTGVSAMLGGFVATVVFVSLFGAILAFDRNLDHGGRVVVWIMMLAAVLLPGVFGLINLARGGFFKGFEERYLQAKLERLQEQQKALLAKQQGRAKELPAPVSVVQPISVTEPTTRELRLQVERNSGQLE